MPYEQRERPAESAAVRRPNNLALEGRKHLTVSGVEEVMGFDEREITMRTGEGDLIVRGEDMHISKLSVEGGDVHIHGRIAELRYEEPAPERRPWKRLFR